MYVTIFAPQIYRTITCIKEKECVCSGCDSSFLMHWWFVMCLFLALRPFVFFYYFLSKLTVACFGRTEWTEDEVGSSIEQFQDTFVRTVMILLEILFLCAFSTCHFLFWSCFSSIHVFATRCKNDRNALEAFKLFVLRGAFFSCLPHPSTAFALSHFLSHLFPSISPSSIFNFLFLFFYLPLITYKSCLPVFCLHFSTSTYFPLLILSFQNLSFFSSPTFCSPFSCVFSSLWWC